MGLDLAPPPPKLQSLIAGAAGQVARIVDRGQGPEFGECRVRPAANLMPSPEPDTGQMTVTPTGDGWWTCSRAGVITHGMDGGLYLLAEPFDVEAGQRCRIVRRDDRLYGEVA